MKGPGARWSPGAAEAGAVASLAVKRSAEEAEEAEKAEDTAVSGRFFVFEGIDGCGKTTQVAALARALGDRGHDVLSVREPGGTPVAEAIRDILLDPANTTITVACEAFLYMAARSLLTEGVITPALERGAIVVSDRFLWSSVVYQGMVGGLGRERVEAMGEVAVGETRPDVIFILDMDPARAMARIPPGRDRIEGRGLEFQTRIRESFLALAAQDPTARVIDAERPVQAIHAEILEVVRGVL